MISAGTLILRSRNGGFFWQEVERVQERDRVASCFPSQRLHSKAVASVTQRRNFIPAVPMRRLNINGTLVSEDARFFVMKAGRWPMVKAKDLRHGDKVLAFIPDEKGTQSRCEVAVHLKELDFCSHPLYDLRVEGHHTYVANGYLIHD